jgi:exodeoxyribonuclease V gamma subunit
MIHLYSAGRARPLAARLADVLTEPPADPMTPEWLAVPSDGMRRWLTLELAAHLGSSGPGSGDGIAANLVRAYPGTLRNCVLAADRDPAEADPWSIDRLVWSVLGVAERHADDPLLSPFLDLAPGASRYANARRIADLFDRYHLHRPDMVRAWAAGQLVDGAGRPIAGHAAWQPRLWQLVRQWVAEPSPPERLPDLLDRLRRGELEPDLPGRLMLFGFTLLPGVGFLELARAVAEHRDVHLFMLEPARLDAERLLQLSPHPPRGGARSRVGDPTAALIEQPLLRSWGRLHRETALLLADGEAGGLPPPQLVEGLPPDSSSVLGRLQHDIGTNAQPGAPLSFDPGDRSLQFHACYGPTRQVEVLRDAILHLLASEPDLTEDDILVLCPALDRFAPLVETVFGPSMERSAPAPVPPHTVGGPTRAPSLRYRIADQSIRSSNPVVRATVQLLELVTGRFEAGTVLDFLSLGPVRERFHFDDEELATIGEWVRATNVRWGADPGHRATFGVPVSVVTNTWQAALDRLMLGAAVYDGDFTLGVGDVAPFGIEGGDVEIAGRLAEAIWHLSDLAAHSAEALPIEQWTQRLRRAAVALFATPRGANWQMEALDGILADMVDAATIRGESASILLTFTDLKRLLDEGLGAMVGRPDFFRGGITVTSMTPLRWIPYRVVCLLGMDQWAFAPVPAAGDDLVAGAPRIGDRDPRGEARQALLEAVLVAEDHLLVLRDGRDVRTNQKVPRAVVAAELFDAAVALVASDQREKFAEQLEINHPRQPFDERCFEVGALAAGVPWGFDGLDFEGAEARRCRVATAVPFLRRPLGPVDADVIELADLHAFFRNPAKAFLTQRLEARLPDSEEEMSRLLPMELTGLEGWNVGDRLLRARLAGVPVKGWRVVERRLGTLPPGSLEERGLSEVVAIVDELVGVAVAHGVRPDPGDVFEVEVELADGTRIVGSVPLRLPPDSPGPARVFYSRSKPHHQVAAWLDLMALVGTDPSEPWRSLTVGRSSDPKAKTVDVTDLVPSAEADTNRASARRSLAVAVDCYRRGMREPLPLFPSFSREVYEGTPGRRRWCTFGGFGDGDDEAVKLAFGAPDYDEIMALPRQPGDPPGSSGRMATFAHYLWGAVEASTAPYRPPADVDDPMSGRRP